MLVFDELNFKKIKSLLAIVLPLLYFSIVCDTEFYLFKFNLVLKMIIKNRRHN